MSRASKPTFGAATPAEAAAALRSGAYKPPPAREPIERRTYANVRRDSPRAGDAWEADWTRVQDERALGNVRSAVREHMKRLRQLAGEEKGRRGRLPVLAEKILELIVRMKTTTGIFDMSAETIAEHVGCSSSAVYGHLRVLKTWGVIEWQRRSRPTGERGKRGPQYEQATNIYRLRRLPEAIAKLAKAARRRLVSLQEALAAAQDARRAQQEAERLKRDARRSQEARNPAIAAGQAKVDAEAFTRWSEALAARIGSGISVAPS